MLIIQISDTHLSPVKPHFADNWAPLAAWIAAERPDLVIHTGDVTVDGADVEEDLRYAVELMRGLGIRFRAVPGNHDVGDAGHPRQPVTSERLERWRAHFGPDRWIEDVEGFRLIGLDAMLLGGGHPEEAAQAAWLEAARANASPGSYTSRCFSTAPMRAIRATGRSNLGRALISSNWYVAIRSAS